MRRLLTILAPILLIASLCAAEKQPPVKIAKDGFPTAQNSPEGVACDYLRAFIKHDKRAFRAVVVKPAGGSELQKQYNRFLETTAKEMEKEAKQKPPSPTAPRAITRCYEARHLAKNGPASYGHAVLNLRDVMFVDVETELENGETHPNRLLVLEEADKKWYVHPSPTMSPILSDGLKDETPSTQEFKRK